MSRSLYANDRNGKEQSAKSLAFYASPFALCCSLLIAHLYAGNRNDFRVHSTPRHSAVAMQSEGQWACSNGWYITGYYVPKEDELPGTMDQIYVERVGNLSFSDDFLTETRTEGWGITRFGWALGHHSGGWHRSDAGPLDAHGNLLTVGMIAIDRSLVPTGADVQISTLPSPWGSKTFKATDVGVGITGQHVDVFTGTGNTAEEETLRITSENNRVCFKRQIVAVP
jgi:3D (Asp-Asp-Asp) domain-containing protein